MSQLFSEVLNLANHTLYYSRADNVNNFDRTSFEKTITVLVHVDE